MTDATASEQGIDPLVDDYPAPRASMGSEIESLPNEEEEGDESFDEYVNHMSDSVHFEEEDMEIPAANAPHADPVGANVREENWTPKRSFLAESPYFSAFVEKEMHELGVVTSVLNDISARTRAFTKYGSLMAEATHALSLSCRLRREEASQEDIKCTPRQLDEEIEKRRQALGPEMSDLLGLLGEVRASADRNGWMVALLGLLITSLTVCIALRSLTILESGRNCSGTAYHVQNF
jgi:hypothetical protein